VDGVGQVLFHRFLAARVSRVTLFPPSPEQNTTTLSDMTAVDCGTGTNRQFQLTICIVRR
jgi:hypothetical protein